MTSVELSIDETTKHFVLSGDTGSLAKNYRARYYLLDFLQAVFNTDGTVAIPYIEEEKEETLKKIQESLRKYGIEQTDSDKIKEVLDHYYSERQNFERFSVKAKDIWGNKVDALEFGEFKRVIEKELAPRRLYDKQLLASFHLAFSQNGCNFSVPGSGKTSIVYAAFAYLKRLPPDHPKRVNKLLVLGPLSSFGPWEDEFLQCFGRTPKSIRLSGGMPKEERDRYLLSIKPIEETPELTLMTYQSVPFNLPNLLHFLQRQGNKVMVVLDEAHRIKNVEGGIWAQAVLNFAKYASARVVLTGTPLPNGYEDIYNLFEFIWPGKDIIDFPVYQLRICPRITWPFCAGMGGAAGWYSSTLEGRDVCADGWQLSVRTLL